MTILGIITATDTQRYCVFQYRNTVIIKNMLLFHLIGNKESWIGLQNRFDRGTMASNLYAPEYVTT